MLRYDQITVFIASDEGARRCSKTRTEKAVGRLAPRSRALELALDVQPWCDTERKGNEITPPRYR